jgi:(p)ppGpp synthase/HD superfamily hydrolase
VTERAPRYSRRLDDALLFAADAFRGRTRKGSSVPYLCHLLQVMVHVGEHGGDEDQLIAALLHDYLEDIEGAERNVVRERFGDRVLDLVEQLSECSGHPKPPWKNRKTADIAPLRTAPAEVKLISTADKLHNATSLERDLRLMGDGVWSRFTGTRDETLWFYDAVTDALGHGWTHPLHDELRGVVARFRR